MTMNVLNEYDDFEGPFASSSEIKNQSGAYIVLGRNRDAERWTVIDTGESATLSERLNNHDRKPCWNGQPFNNLAFAVKYAGEQERMQIEAAVRKDYNPACGDR